MKNGLLLLAAGSLLVGSCKSGMDRSDMTNPGSAGSGAPKATAVASKAGLLAVHPISVSLTQSDPDLDTRQVTWKLRGTDHHGRSETIHSNEVVQWHFSSSFFVYFDEAKSEFTNWDKCTVVNGNPPFWTNCTCCPFNQTKHRALSATNIMGDWVVGVVFPPYAAPRGSAIKYHLVTDFDCFQPMQQGKPGILAATYEYSMVEATLVWDSAGFKEPRSAK